MEKILKVAPKMCEYRVTDQNYMTKRSSVIGSDILRRKTRAKHEVVQKRVVLSASMTSVTVTTLSTTITSSTRLSYWTTTTPTKITQQ